MADYDLESLRERSRKNPDENRNYESFNISKELEKVRKRAQDQKGHEKKSKKHRY